MTTPLLSSGISLGSLFFNGRESSGVVWAVQPPVGWGSPKPTINVAQKPRASGGWAGTSFLSARSIVLAGSVDAPTPALLSDALDRLNAAASLDSTILIVNESGRSRFVNVRRQDEVLAGFETPTSSTWSIQLVAVDPRKFGSTVFYSTGLPSSTGGLTWGNSAIPFHDSSVARANSGSPPVTADSGQTFTYAAVGGASYQINAGALVVTSRINNAAAYQLADVGARGQRIGARFTFGAGSTFGTGLGLIFFATSAPGSDSQCHLVIGPATWGYYTLTSSVLTLLQSGSWTLPINTELGCDVTIVGNTATLQMPDGTTKTVTDASIGANAGRWACFETAMNTTAATDQLPSVISTWSDTAASTGSPFGLTWAPIAWTGVSTSGVISVVNPGNTTAPLTLRIDGPVTGPIVTHVSTGTQLVFASSLTLAAGEWLTVDMERREVLANGQESRNGYVTSRGWFGLDPGPNDISFQAATYNPSALLTVIGPNGAWL